MVSLYSPRRTSLVFRVVRNRLSAEGNLRKCNIYTTFRCSMCGNAAKSIEPLFYECAFAKSAWLWVFDKFQFRGRFIGGRVEFIKHLLVQSMGSQVYNLWVATIVIVI